MTPLYVAFTVDERLVGDASKNQAVFNPANTVFDAIRLDESTVMVLCKRIFNIDHSRSLG
jgi:molecular chaperone DnaK (HSP70)